MSKSTPIDLRNEEIFKAAPAALIFRNCRILIECMSCPIVFLTYDRISFKYESEMPLSMINSKIQSSCVLDNGKESSELLPSGSSMLIFFVKSSKQHVPIRCQSSDRYYT